MTIVTTAREMEDELSMPYAWTQVNVSNLLAREEGLEEGVKLDESDPFEYHYRHTKKMDGFWSVVRCKSPTPIK